MGNNSDGVMCGWIAPARGTELYQKQRDGMVNYKEEIEHVIKSHDCNFEYCTGVMGVPITMIDKYSPEQFEIVAFRKGEDGKDLVFTRERESSTVLSCPCTTSIPGMIKNAEGKINGKHTYARITIRQKLSQ